MAEWTGRGCSIRWTDGHRERERERGREKMEHVYVNESRAVDDGGLDGP